MGVRLPRQVAPPARTRTVFLRCRSRTETAPCVTVVRVPAQVSVVTQAVPRTVATLLRPCVRNRPPESVLQRRRVGDFLPAAAERARLQPEKSPPRSTMSVMPLPVGVWRTSNMPPRKEPVWVVVPTELVERDRTRAGVDDAADRDRVAGGERDEAAAGRLDEDRAARRRDDDRLALHGLRGRGRQHGRRGRAGERGRGGRARSTGAAGGRGAGRREGLSVPSDGRRPARSSRAGARGTRCRASARSPGGTRRRASVSPWTTRDPDVSRRRSSCRSRTVTVVVLAVRVDVAVELGRGVVDRGRGVRVTHRRPVRERDGGRPDGEDGEDGCDEADRLGHETWHRRPRRRTAEAAAGRLT